MKLVAPSTAGIIGVWCELVHTSSYMYLCWCGLWTIRLATKHCAHVNIHTPVLQPPNRHTRVVVCTFVGCFLATKVFIGKLPATRGVWVIVG